MADNDDFKIDDLDLSDKMDRKLFNLGYRMGSGGKKPPKRPREPEHNFNRNKPDYVFFGHFPQTIKPRNVSIGSETHDFLYRGSDNEKYCRKVYKNGKYNAGMFTYAAEQHHINSSVSRFSDGQSSGEYFRIDPIKWRVIHRENGVLTLMSENILFYHQFNRMGGSYAYLLKAGRSWNTSEIRKVLNDEFYSTAFSVDEQNCILTTSLKTETDNLSIVGKLSNSEANDKVFLLSKTEYGEYGLIRGDLQKHHTDFCGHYIDCIYETPQTVYSFWMTRTASDTTYEDINEINYACPYAVCGNGRIDSLKEKTMGIVPVIRVREEDVTVYSDDILQTNPTQYGNNESKSTYTPPAKPQQPTTFTFAQKIKYTILAPVYSLVGIIVGMFLLAMFGTNGQSAMGLLLILPYTVISIILVWKRKKMKIKTIKILVHLNIAIACIAWMLLARY